MMTVVLVIAIALYAIGHFVMLIEAFRESVLWGVACLLLPVVLLFFLIVHWPEAKKGFVLQVWGVVVLVLGFIFVPLLR